MKPTDCLLLRREQNFLSSLAALNVRRGRTTPVSARGVIPPQALPRPLLDNQPSPKTATIREPSSQRNHERIIHLVEENCEIEKYSD
jgi:hypothetical protein